MGSVSTLNVPNIRGTRNNATDSRYHQPEVVHAKAIFGRGPAMLNRMLAPLC